MDKILSHLIIKYNKLIQKSKNSIVFINFLQFRFDEMLPGVDLNDGKASPHFHAGPLQHLAEGVPIWVDLAQMCSLLFAGCQRHKQANVVRTEKILK